MKKKRYYKQVDNQLFECDPPSKRTIPLWVMYLGLLGLFTLVHVALGYIILL